jgi:hypothetical protein
MSSSTFSAMSVNKITTQNIWQHHFLQLGEGAGALSSMIKLPTEVVRIIYENYRFCVGTYISHTPISFYLFFLEKDTKDGF